MAFSIKNINLANGARLGISPLPGRGDAGLKDVAAIIHWNPTLVLSMTEMIEMERHNMGDLAGMLAPAGIDWAHFPIHDFGTPDGVGDWPVLSKHLHSILDGGGSILAHCYGGQGRSGMVLLRLLVERGVAPPDALASIRGVVPGAVETAAQQAWGSAGVGQRAS